MIPNGEGWHYYPVKKLPALSKDDGDFYFLKIVFICLELKTNANLTKTHVKIKISEMQ